MTSVAQRSFAGGEVSPATYGRADQAKYATGARRIRNFIVQRFGGVTNRPGTQFVAEARDGNAHPIRIVKFIYNNDQTYVLEFGHQHMRVYRNGASVVPTDDDYYFPGGAYYTGQIYPVGALVLEGGVHYYCAVEHGAFGADKPPGTPLGVNYWIPMTVGYYEIPTTYNSADLRRLQFTQSADVMTIFHPTYPVQELRRYGEAHWMLAAAAFTPTIDRPASCSVTAGAAGANSYRYRVTAVKPDTFEESLAARETGKPFKSITWANPAKVQTCTDPPSGGAPAAAHGYSTGDEVYFPAGIGLPGYTDDQTFTITVTSATEFTLDGLDASAAVSLVLGYVHRTYARVDSAATPSASAPNVINWTAVADALEYNVYKETNGVYGFIGTAVGTSFKDINYAPSGLTNLPTHGDVFDAAGKYPQTGAYIQQRLAAAGSNDAPESIKMSRIGIFGDFSTSSPLQDDDAIGFSINDEVNEVRHIVNVGKPVVFTSGSIWTLDGDNSGALRWDTVNPNLVDRRGSSYLRPIVIGNTLLYVQARGTIIRDLQLDLVQGQKGQDLTIYAQHLFDGYTIVAWAYQENPHSVLWVVRSDGAMLGLTYVKEHEVWGWFTCDTDGSFLDVTSVPEGDEDALYVVVERTIDGTARRFVERFASRRVADLATDAFFMDCGGSYDGTNDTATTLTLSTASTWAYTEPITLTASAAIFSALEVGNAYVLTIGGVSLSCTVTAYTDTTHVTVEPASDVPASHQGVATATWSRAVDQVTGLSHLEGKSVAVLADGNVVANGFDDPQLTVTGGTLTLATPASIIHVGLPYLSDLETLDWEDPNSETLIDKQKLVQGVTLLMQDTRGGWAGCPKTDDDGTAEWLTKNMSEIKQRAAEGYSSATAVRTGTFDKNTAGTWGEKGRILVRQRDPLPMTILAAVPRGKIGG